MTTLDLKQVSKSFRGQEILREVTFTLTSGEILGIQGINGSGKSVLLKMISGLMKPTSGEITVDGKRIGKDVEHPDSVGIVIENPHFIGEFSGFDNLKYLAMIKKIIGEKDILHFLDKLDLLYAKDKKVRKYSLGMKQRLGLAQAFMETPNLILLDEPTNALDEKGVKIISRLLEEERQRGAAILITSHDPYFLDAICTRRAKLREGVVYEDA